MLLCLKKAGSSFCQVRSTVLSRPLILTWDISLDICGGFSYQRTLKSEDGCRSCLLQRLHATPPPAPSEAVHLLHLQVEPPEQGGVLPAFPLCLIWTQLEIQTHARAGTWRLTFYCTFLELYCHLAASRENDSSNGRSDSLLLVVEAKVGSNDV